MRTFRKRYLKLRIEGPTLDESGARRLVQETLMQFLGEQNAALSRFRFIQWDSPYALVLVSHDQLENAVAAFALKRFWQGSDVAVRVEKTSGSLLSVRGYKKKKLERK